MHLMAGPAPDILRFIQVLSWIIMPVLLTTVGLTMLVHYRKKKRETNEGSDLEGKLVESVSSLVGYTNGNGEYIVFDNSVLIQQYKNSLSYNRARYTALQHDYAKMETKYAALALYARNLFVKPKKEIMEHSHEMPREVQADINRVAKDHAAEKNELQDKLAQLERSCRQLEQENKALHDQLTMHTATDDERAAIITKWKEENAVLRDKVADQEYLQDLLDEKKAQLSFLQNQLEQRIKNLYQSEHQRLQTVAEMKQLKEDKEGLKTEIIALNDELLRKQEQIDKAQVVLCEKEELLGEKEQLLNTKLEHITSLETLLKESREQNDLSSSSLVGNKELVDGLQRQLADEQSKVQFLSQKLFASKQMIRRLHKEVSALIEEDEESPVIPIRPEYSNKGTEDIIVQ